MVSKPLTHLGQECVLQYLDANQRFQISHRCPTLTSIEERLPLIVRHLEILRNRFNINDTVYRVGVYQQYPPGMAIPKQVAIDNQGFGSRGDLDIYGLPVQSPQAFYHTTSLSHRKIEQDLMKIQQLKDLLQRRHGVPMQSVLNEIKEIETSLQPHLMKRDKIQPPWTLLLKITIIDQHGASRVEFGEYTNLNQHLVQLMDRILGLGHRKAPIYIQTWSFNFREIPLPVNLKLRIRKFVSSEYQVDLFRVQQHIHDSCFPLDLVKLNEIKLPLAEMVKTAKKLVLHKGAPMELLQELQCMKFETSGFDWNTEKYSTLIRNWQESEKPIGTCFEFRHEVRKEQILDSLAGRFNGELDGLRQLRIPMNSTSEVEVCIAGVRPMNIYTPWSLRFKVVAV